MNLISCILVNIQTFMKLNLIKGLEMMYINIKEDGKVETLDEFETYKEAIKMLKEYIIASSYYRGAYISRRCTKEWRSTK